MTWLPWIGLVVCVLAIALVSLTALGAKRWIGRMAILAGRLEAGRNCGFVKPPHPKDTTHYDPRELDGLPAPVQCYFRAVLQDGQPIVCAVTIEMTGTINMSATADQWKKFTSKQRVVTSYANSGLGFMWDAQIAMLPGIKVHVLDGYIAGKGVLRAAMLGLFTVADVSGGGEMARGEFMRFFAEAAWYPTALLPSQGVRWEAVDEHSANASIVDGPLTLTLLFGFNEAGLINSVRAEARGAMVGNQVIMMPWECSLSDYQVRDGMMVPLTGEAAWIRPEGRQPYFHGSITSLHCEFATQ